MKSKSFVLSAIILSLGGFFAKAIGALYKIPLTNILGSAGMGLYYLVFPIYSLVITFCSSGISVALTIEVAKCRKIRHRYNEQKLLRVALVLSFVLSAVLTFVIVLSSHTLAELQGNVNAGLGYIAIAPAIILSTLIATLRGYFQGIENMVPTTVSLIIEQIIKLTIGLILAHRLCFYGLEYAVLGAILGVTISEIVALIIIAINFFTYKGQLYYNYRNLNYRSRKHLQVVRNLKSKIQYNLGFKKTKIFRCNNIKVRYSTKVALKKLLKLMVPNTLSGIIIPISTMLDSFMIINLLVSSGYSTAISTSLYGLLGGVVQSLISLPTIIVTALSTSLVPSLSGLIVRNDTNEINLKVAFFIKLNWIFGVLMFLIIYVCAEGILIFLYGDGFSNNIIDEMYYAIKMLKLSSVSIIYYSFLQTFSAILQTISKSHISFFALTFSFIIRTILIWILIPIININIYGAIIANTVFISLTAIILAWFVVKYLNVKFKLNSLVNPIFAGVILLLLGMLGYFTLKKYIGYFVSMCIIALILLIIYLIWMYFGKVFNEKELRFFRLKKRKLAKSNKQKNDIKT